MSILKKVIAVIAGIIVAPVVIIGVLSMLGYVCFSIWEAWAMLLGWL